MAFFCYTLLYYTCYKICSGIAKRKVFPELLIIFWEIAYEEYNGQKEANSTRIRGCSEAVLLLVISSFLFTICVICRIYVVVGN